MSSLRIGQLATRTGVAIDTIRYYERNGLLQPPDRRASGYRCYGESDIRRLRFIRRAKTLGFALGEIGTLLGLSADHDVARVKQTAQAKLADVECRLADLTRVRDALRALVDACPGHGRAERCPILAALDSDGVAA